MLIEESEKRSTCKIGSIFEVGCGSGANLFLFEKNGYRTGGVDYSESLVKVADNVLQSDDITCNEAINIATSRKYDVVLSNSVFSYFPDIQYAEKVLDKCLNVAKYAIGLIDIHDADRMGDFIEFRKREIADYENLYRNLPKLFFSKSFFKSYAKRHSLDIVFTEGEMENYWNNGYVFDVFLYKNI